MLILFVGRIWSCQVGPFVVKWRDSAEGQNKRYVGEEIATLLWLPDGLVSAVGDLGTVRDDFADVTTESNQWSARDGCIHR